ncbi:MAG: hypothetical protein CM1200mP15_17050 [Dehalococcoidia bacterium]|nr:MAG: hypothetical protein CM1200mP15_17050 [Dehalococcoidia bacterium]
MRFGMFYELQMPKPWGPDAEYNTLWQAVEQVTYAEEMGFEHVWLVEHHFLTEFAHSSAPEVTLAIMAERTSKMRLGFGVVLSPVHHPLHVAARVATLDIFSNGRVDVGVGRTKGPYQVTPFGSDVSQTQSMMTEMLECLPKMWTQEVFSHEGQHWSIPPREVIPKPIQKPHPPLWMACTQEDTFRMAGDLGLGCLVNTLGGTDKTRLLIDAYYDSIENANPVGHFLNKQVVASTIGFCDENGKKAREKGADVASWYLNQSKQRFALEWAGVDPDGVPLNINSTLVEGLCVVVALHKTRNNRARHRKMICWVVVGIASEILTTASGSLKSLNQWVLMKLCLYFRLAMLPIKKL